MNANHLTNEEIKQLIMEKKITAADLTNAGICPTCFNKENNNVLYGDNDDKIIYEDSDFECFLVSNPRAKGHTVISTKKHYKDMLEINNEICKKIFLLAQKVMIVLKETFQAESIYLCTMCDGPMNHFHIQLIPRYSYEKRGSKNFVKPRSEYIENKEKIIELRNKLGYHNNLLSNITKLHTTELGKKRIIKNLELTEIDVISYLTNKILKPNCQIYKRGKNYYCEVDNIIITINGFNYCVITAHTIRKR